MKQYTNNNLDNRHAKFDFCIDDLPIPIGIINTEDDRIIAFNDAMKNFFGISAKDEMLGETALAISAPRQLNGRSSAEQYAEYKKRILANGMLTFEWLCQVNQLIQKVIIHIESYEQDGAQYMQVLFIDAELFSYSNAMLKKVEASNEKKELDNVLNISDLTYKNVLDSVNELVYIIDNDGTIIDINRAVSDKYGYTKSELIGQKPDFFSAQGLNDIEKIGEQLIQAFNGEPTRFLFWSKRKDGGIFPKETNAIPGTYFGKKVIIVIGRDVTEKQAIENQLIESEKRYRTLFELMPQGIIQFAYDGTILEINDAAHTILGLPVENMKTRQYILDNIMILYSDGKSYKEEDFPVTKALTAGKAVVNHVVQIYNKLSKATKWLTINAVPLFKPNASIPHQAFVTLEDITLLKNTQIELIKAKEKAEESNRLKSEFLANISHEIRTPLNGVIGFANLLKQPDLSNDKRYHYVDIVIQSGKRMLSLINDLISMSKIASKQVDIRNEMTNINKTLDSIYNLFETEVHEKNMQLFVQKSLLEPKAEILTDSEKLHAILTNLVKNSIKYSNEGSIEIGYTVKDKFIEFYVKDTGIGIPKSDIDNVFNRFVQAKNVNTIAAQGVGLGLAITKGYVEMLGGKIWVESKQDVGSTFYFTIPLASNN